MISIENGFQCRQGDIAFIIVENLPENLQPKPNVLKDRKNNIVALGESHGHRHEIFGATVMVDDLNRMFVSSDGTAAIHHLDASNQVADHPMIEQIPVGNYWISPQDEYTPKGWRQVED